jgi:hypothetical protein
MDLLSESFDGGDPRARKGRFEEDIDIEDDTDPVDDLRLSSGCSTSWPL